MFCVKCGNELQEDSKFCGKCGSLVDVKDYKTSEKHSKSNLISKIRCFVSKKKRSLIIGVGLFVVVAGVAITCFTIKNLQDENIKIMSFSGNDFKLWNSLDEKDIIDFSVSNYNGENADAVFFSEDGKYMYYFSDIDSSGYEGTLCRVDINHIENGKAQNGYKIEIDQNVEYGVSNFGDQLVYKKGNELYHFNGEDSKKIAEGIRMYQDVEDVGVVYILDETDELFYFDFADRHSRKIDDNVDYLEFFHQKYNRILYYAHEGSLCLASPDEMGCYKLTDNPCLVREIDDSIYYIDCDDIITANIITDGVVKQGDTVCIDFVCMIDGKEIDGGTAEGYELEIGSGTFIDGFEDGLIGHKVGDEVLLELMFPENNVAESVSGKMADFLVTINYICGDDNTNNSGNFISREVLASLDGGTLYQVDGVEEGILMSEKLYSNVVDYDALGKDYLQIVRKGEMNDVLFWPKNDDLEVESVSLEKCKQWEYRYFVKEGDEIYAIDSGQTLQLVIYDDDWIYEHPNASIFNDGYAPVETNVNIVGTDEKGFYYMSYRDYETRQGTGDLYYYTDGYANKIASNISDLKSSIGVCSYKDGKVCAIQEYDSDFELAIFDGKGNTEFVSNGVSEYVRLASNKIIYISNNDMYLYNGKTSKLLMKDVSKIWTYGEMENKYKPYEAYELNMPY